VIVKRIEALARATAGIVRSKQGGCELFLDFEDAVARPDPAVHLQCDLLPRTHLFHWFVFDLHRSNHLPEIGGAAQNMKDVAQTDRITEVEDRDAEPSIVVGYVTDEFTGHGCLLLLPGES
jgi:hypothetical protein